MMTGLDTRIRSLEKALAKAKRLRTLLNAFLQSSSTRRQNPKRKSSKPKPKWMQTPAGREKIRRRMKAYWTKRRRDQKLGIKKARS